MKSQSHRASNAFIGITLCALLSACDNGSSNSAPAQLLQGQFIDSPVANLYYETPTQSGLTDINGTFFYQEGEAVTFKVGNIKLGISPGAEVITPFTLSGHAPLDNESEILKSLKSSHASSYEKALNIATFLQTLDLDTNPENGIDLGESHRLLSNFESSINFFDKATGFAQNPEFSKVKEKLNISAQPRFQQVVEHLYSSLDISISSSKPSQKIELNGSTISQRQSFEYNSLGLVERINISNGTLDQSTNAIQFTYDAQGNLTGIQQTDSDETLQYDDNNRLVSRSKTDSNQTKTETFDYADNGQLENFTVDKDDDGTADFSAQYQYSTDGKLRRIAIDQDGDSNTDQSTLIDFSGDVINEYAHDQDGNGEQDLIISYKYDERGNRVTQNTLDNNDTAPTLSVSSFEYDSQNNPIRFQRDDNRDGTPEYIESYRYNAANQRTEYKRDNNADGIWDFVAQYFYDKNGNRIKMIEDSDGNGLVDKVWESSYQSATLDNSWGNIVDSL